jgi:hypothetical protein
MQVLEGDDTAVDETYARIRQDLRHTGLMLIDRAPIKVRSFEDWSMGFKRLEPPDLAGNPNYVPFLRYGFDAAGIRAKEGLALDMLKHFASTQGR